MAVTSQHKIMQSSGIYSITHNGSGKIYIGSAVHLRKRIGIHKTALRAGKHCNVHLQRAYNKYGEDAFTFKPILVCSKGDLLFYEQSAIDAFGAYGDGYNQCPVAGSAAGRKDTDATRVKKSIALMGNKCASGRVIPKDVREKISFSLKGHAVSEAARKKMSIAKKGKKLSDAHKLNVSVSLKGKKFSEDRKEGLRKAWVIRRMESHKEKAKCL